MSNLIKSNFVAFSNNNKLLVDPNKHRIVREHEADTRDIVIGTSDENIDDLDIEDILREHHGYQEAEVEPQEIQPKRRETPEEMLEEAMKEASRILEEARIEAGEIAKNAQAEGYKVGYAEGCKLGADEYDSLKNQLHHETEHIKNELAQEKAGLLEEVETKVVDIVCELIEIIIGVAVEDNKEVMLHIINNAIKNIENSKSFIIKVSDSDYGYIEEKKDTIYGALNPSIDMEIFSDSKLKKGQCLIETDGGLVDGSLNVQIDNLTMALKLLSRV